MPYFTLFADLWDNFVKKEDKRREKNKRRSIKKKLSKV